MNRKENFSMDKSIEELITEETTHRLKEMSSDSYDFPKKATPVDYICILAAILICLLLIILCMTGVIA